MDTVAIVIPIDAVPPNVQSVSGVDNITVDSRRPAHCGRCAQRVLVTGLTAPDSKRVHVNIAGVDHAALGIVPLGSAHRVQVVLSPAVGAGQVPLTVSMDGRGSPAYYLPVQR